MYDLVEEKFSSMQNFCMIGDHGRNDYLLPKQRESWSAFHLVRDSLDVLQKNQISSL